MTKNNTWTASGLFSTVNTFFSPAYSVARRLEQLLAAELKDVPYKFQGAFATVAIKDGASEIFHLDFNDKEGVWAFVFGVGDWSEGGDICLPQVGYRFAMKEGDVFAFPAKTFLHCATPVKKGTRYVFTLFMDKFLYNHAC